MIKKITTAFVISVFLYLAFYTTIYAQPNLQETSQKELDISILKNEINDIVGRVSLLENDKAKDDGNLYDRIITQKDNVYEKVLDDLKANAEEANSNTSFIIDFFTFVTAIFALIGTVLGVWGFTVNKKITRIKNEAIKTTEEIERKLQEILKVECDIKTTLSQAQAEFSEVSASSEKAGDLVEEMEAYRNAIEHISDLKDKIEKDSDVVYNLGRKLEGILSLVSDDKAVEYYEEIESLSNEIEALNNVNKEDYNQEVIENGRLQEKKIKKQLNEIVLEDDVNEGGQNNEQN